MGNEGGSGGDRAEGRMARGTGVARGGRGGESEKQMKICEK